MRTAPSGPPARVGNSRLWHAAPGSTTTQPRIVSCVPSVSIRQVTSESTCTLWICFPTRDRSKKLMAFLIGRRAQKEQNLWGFYRTLTAAYLPYFQAWTRRFSDAVWMIAYGYYRGPCPPLPSTRCVCSIRYSVRRPACSGGHDARMLAQQQDLGNHARWPNGLEWVLRPQESFRMPAGSGSLARAQALMALQLMPWRPQSSPAELPNVIMASHPRRR